MDAIISVMFNKSKKKQLGNPDNISMSDYIDTIMCEVGIHLANAISKDKLFLLPSLFRDFVN